MILTLIFSILLIFFTTVFLEKWKREEGQYKHIWGLTDIRADYTKISGYHSVIE